jgi:hypothetical protein
MPGCEAFGLCGFVEPAFSDCVCCVSGWCGRLKAALEKKSLKRQQLQASGSDGLSEAAGALSQRCTPVKRQQYRLVDEDLPDAREDVQLQAQPLQPCRSRAVLPCLLLVSCFLLSAALFAVTVLPTKPQVLPLIY